MNQKEISAYKSIKAPLSIKERILEEERLEAKKYMKLSRLCYSAAAIAAAFLIAFLFLTTSSPSLYYGGEIISENAVIIERKMARSITETLTLPILIETDKKAEVSVSVGVLVVDGEEVGQKKKIKESTDIVWIIDEPDAEGSLLTVDAGKSSRYTISREEDSNTLLIKKIK